MTMTYTGVHRMTAEDLARFTLAVISKSIGVDLGKKYNPSQPRNAHGEWTSGGGGSEHGESSGGGGVEKGSVFVGSKDSEGESISHPTNGGGTIKSVDAKNETITVEHSDGSTKQYAASFASQKAKFVQTGSEQGKTHIANVKVSKSGDVTNRDDDKKVGSVGKGGDGTWSYLHSSGAAYEGGFTSKHAATVALVSKNNELAEKASAAAEEKPEEAKPEEKPAETASKPAEVDDLADWEKDVLGIGNGSSGVERHEAGEGS